MSKLVTANLEAGHPTCNQALLRLDFELHAARRAGARAIKLIHGYGSGGAGGALRQAVQAALRLKLSQGQISAFVPGEDWRVSNEIAWEMQTKVPELKRDRDLGRGNKGISLVLL